MNSAELSFELTLYLCITLKANQFITPIPVCKTKYFGMTVLKNIRSSASLTLMAC